MWVATEDFSYHPHQFHINSTSKHRLQLLLGIPCTAVDCQVLLLLLKGEDFAPLITHCIHDIHHGDGLIMRHGLALGLTCKNGLSRIDYLILIASKLLGNVEMAFDLWSGP